ncbi:hypothetical protein HZB06_00795 [Candidatus Wolfebacteria bacterium]|nr:hypothetical protein [Candidatus Wolfebacteria bacterium]
MIFTFLFLHFVNAQTAPQFFVSWQADSYSPSWYQGKIFPTQGNRIKAGFELTENGKIIDLSKNRVRWYVNDELVKNEDNGLGIKSFSFVVSDYAGEDIEVKIAVLPCDRACAGYNKGEILYKIIKIPVVSPEAVMDAPYKERQISTGENKFFAYPFFFSVKNLDKLSFSWLINGQEAKGGDKESDILNLNINPAVISGDAVNLRLTIKNLLKDLEFGSVEKKLIIK